MTLVVDASIATKWLLDEAGSDAARAILDREELIPPDLVLGETYHAVWKRWRRGEALVEQVEAVVPRLTSVFDHIEPMASTIAEAGRLGVRFKHPIYDCIYLSLAQRTASVLVTADDRQFEMARRLRVEARLI